MLSNPKKYCLIQYRKEDLRYIQFLAEVYPKLPPESQELAETEMKRVGAISSSLKKEIASCAIIGDSEWFLRAKLLAGTF